MRAVSSTSEILSLFFTTDPTDNLAKPAEAILRRKKNYLIAQNTVTNIFGI
jgi:hypothetical protein